jgi:signal transduction histidine kinase
MLLRLRLQLTVLYTLVALALIVLLGVGTYRLLSSYFQQTTDLGLQHKMAHEFRLLGAPLPEELIAADRDWYANRAILFPDAPTATTSSDVAALETGEGAVFYDGELSAIFVLPLDKAGRLVFDPNPYTPPVTPDQQAVQAALESGHDWRTIQLVNGTAVRLLTYRVTRDDGPAVLQLGRALVDQQRVLNQLTLILLVLGVVIAVLLGMGSWWLAGRSLVPAQRAWERQQVFVANASHELRTPLALIRASADSAGRRLTDEHTRQKRLLNDVIEECDHMTRLVNDLLLLSRLDSGQVRPELVAVDLPDFLADIQRQVGHLAEERQINLTLGTAEGTVQADPPHLRQVLLILLDNALRHTPAGGTVELCTRLQRPHIHIQVRDSGSGIAPEHLPHVFERFYRAEHNRSNGTGGSGLGLSLARALMETQHGQISIESAPGRGTDVTLSLPAAVGGIDHSLRGRGSQG